MNSLTNQNESCFIICQVFFSTNNMIGNLGWEICETMPQQPLKKLKKLWKMLNRFWRRLFEFIVWLFHFFLTYGVSIFFHSFHIRVVQATVSSSSVDTSDTSKLLETILVQLRQVVLNLVRNALRTSTYPLDAQSLTIRIIKNLRPFVAEALKKELSKRPAPTPAPIPAPSGGLSSIFGNGENFVKVESPDINYNYEFNAPQTRK